MPTRLFNEGVVPTKSSLNAHETYNERENVVSTEVKMIITRRYRAKINWKANRDLGSSSGWASLGQYSQLL